MLNCILVQRQTKGSEHVQNRLGRLRFASLEPNMDDTLSIFLELLFCVALVPFPACSENFALRIQGTPKRSYIAEVGDIKRL
ncbi:unnamed protein product [Pocillopora meandrina]|uniref:Uncharacterized protein n=1 Tax=Pocillopora meandrina TaxID=46732 RepID=A0AAU9WRM7_9CNID|nr:unnamed protein product [Pocillopora meandrina]